MVLIRRGFKTSGLNSTLRVPLWRRVQPWLTTAGPPQDFRSWTPKKYIFSNPAVRDIWSRRRRQCVDERGSCTVVSVHHIVGHFGHARSICSDTARRCTPDSMHVPCVHAALQTRSPTELK